MAGRYDVEIQGAKDANVVLRCELYAVRDTSAAALAQAHAELRDELGRLVKDLESKAHTFEIETFGRIKILEDELKKQQCDEDQLKQQQRQDQLHLNVHTHTWKIININFYFLY